MADETSYASTARFQNLGDANYDKWSPRMEADLIRRGLWEGIVEILVDPKDKTPEQISTEFETKKSKSYPGQIRQKCVEMNALGRLIARHGVQNASLIPHSN